MIKEQHIHEHQHEEFGTSLSRAIAGGAITGLASSIGVKGGEYLGNMASTGITTNSALSASVNAGVKAATMSYSTSIGTSMSNTAIYGGDFGDVMKAGWKSAGDKDTLNNVAISGLSAGITAGLTQKLNLDVKNNFTDKLAHNAISGASNTALQSTINGDSFKDTLKHQVVNSLVMTGAEYGANAIGSNYYDKNINKATQLTLHAGLGAITSKLTGGDYLSGAISGVVGELTAEFISEKYYDGKDNLTDKQRENVANMSGLFSGLSAIITASSQNKDLKHITNEAYAGQRVGQNAAENNYLYPHEKANLLKELENCKGDSACRNEVQNKYKEISDPRDKEFNEILLYGSVEDLENIHYDLRDKLTKEGNDYYNSLSKEDREKEFIKLPDSASIYHTFQQDENGNVINVLSGSEKGYTKFIHPKYGYEVVLDSSGNIVENPLNIGTYNFYNPKLDGVESNPLINGNFNHVLYDVLPYYKLGNSKKDPTIGSDRIIRNLNILFNK